MNSGNSLIKAVSQQMKKCSIFNYVSKITPNTIKEKELDWGGGGTGEAIYLK